jgi:RimJ/RimL family protein N-acetyltransferase
MNKEHRQMNAPEVIHTDRLRLRRPVFADAEAIFTNYASDIDVTRYMAWPRHVSLDDTHAFLRFSDADWQQHSVGTYLVELAGSVVGSTGIHFGRDSAVDRCAETGYVFAKHVWGKGYASEVLQAMVALAAQLDLKRLRAGCHPDNFASRHVLEKGGFTAAATFDVPMLFPNISPTSVVALRYQRLIGRQL